MDNGYHHGAAMEEDRVKNIDSKCNGNHRENSTIKYIKNPYINEEDDVLFHLTLSNKTDDLETMFHDVKFVCMGGTAHRMKEFARLLMEEFEYPVPKEGGLVDLSANGHRYSMFKVGRVLCVNHGMGYPSINILLHELVKLMQYANVRDPIFLRLGTSGGIDVPAGTVVIATKALNDYLEPHFEVPILGKKHRLPCLLDQKLAYELKKTAVECNFPVLLGCTVSSEHFYESTAMKAGAICERSDADRREYYQKLKSHKVLNMDMESVVLSSITHKVGIKAAIINVVVNDCFTEEEDAPTAEKLKIWQKRPLILAIEYIKKHYNNNECE